MVSPTLLLCEFCNLFPLKFLSTPPSRSFFALQRSWAFSLTPPCKAVAQCNPCLVFKTPLQSTQREGGCPSLLRFLGNFAQGHLASHSLCVENSVTQPPAQPAVCRFVTQFILISHPTVADSCFINNHWLKKRFCSTPEQSQSFLENNVKIPCNSNQEDREGGEPITGSGDRWPEQQEKHPVPQVLYPPGIYGKKDKKNLLMLG